MNRGMLVAWKVGAQHRAPVVVFGKVDATTKPRQPCPVPGCPNLQPCPVHHKQPWAGRRGFEGYKDEYLRLRAQVLKEEPVCRICGLRPSVTVDHVIPKSQGGTDDRSNLRGACKECHDERSKAQAARGRWGSKV